MQGMYAVAGDTPTATVMDCRKRVVHALVRMTLDWVTCTRRPTWFRWPPADA